MAASIGSLIFMSSALPGSALDAAPNDRDQSDLADVFARLDALPGPADRMQPAGGASAEGDNASAIEDRLAAATSDDGDNAASDDAVPRLLEGLDGQDDVLRGGRGNDILDGRAGADLMIGGRGNDTYHVDDDGDVVVEHPGGGIDRVIATESYALGDNVENLQLTFHGNASATGNALDNYIGGNSGNNTLDGRGGADKLFGGGGADTFAFWAGEADGDVVGDFTAQDHLLFAGYGKDATFVQVGGSDSYRISTADGSLSDTVQIKGVFDLATGVTFNDVLFI